MSAPLVSVIVPNYNHFRFLPRRLESIFCQTFCDFELILMDDCSTDGSRRLLENLANRPNTRLLLNEKNSGSTFKQWKKGIDAAGGKYIWIAESDDFAAPTFLHRLVTLLESNPNAGLAYCESNIVNELDEVQGLHPGPHGWGDDSRWQKDFISNGKEECANYMVRTNIVPNASAAVFRRDIYIQSGGADGSMRLCGDWKLWTQMLLISDLVHVAEPSNFFRFHSQNVRSSTRQWQSITEAVSVMEFIQRSVQVPSVAMRLARNRIADDWINAWLHREPVDSDKRAETFKKLEQFDPSFRRRLISRSIIRSFALIRKGRVLHWMAHLRKPARL